MVLSPTLSIARREAQSETKARRVTNITTDIDNVMKHSYIPSSLQRKKENKEVQKMQCFRLKNII